MRHYTRAERICDLILERGLKVKWCCYARVNAVTRPLLGKMKAAGCFGLDFGVESGSQEVLDRVKKHITLDQARGAIKLARACGIMTYASFMIGLPGDDLCSAQKTIEFAAELHPDIAHFFVATPFPGTEFYQEAAERNWIDKLDSWKDLDISVPTKCRNDALTHEDMQRLLGEAYRRFYRRPTFYWQSVGNLLRNPRLLRQYVLGGLAVLNLATADR